MTPFGSAGEVHVSISSDGEPGTADNAGSCGADGTEWKKKGILPTYAGQYIVIFNYSQLHF